MLISASYKTDIPTFYGDWFMRRLEEGYCKMVNPSGRQVYEVSLAREDVDGIVFWTKNIGPMLKHLPEIAARGYPFVVQHTINGYPRELEARVVDYARTVECMRRVADEYGPLESGAPRVIWRYDPIIFTSLTRPDWHKRNFETIAKALEGATNEVVISFAQIYKKTRRNMEEAGFSVEEHEAIAYPDDPTDHRALHLAIYLAGIAAAQGMTLKVCAQKRFLVPGIIEEARCIDAGWFGQEYKKHGNRTECACSASRDIGEYDTCPHGCVYCYAVQNRELALARHKRHDPEGEFLFPPEFEPIQVQRRPRPAKAKAEKSEKTPAKARKRTTRKEAGAEEPMMAQQALFS